MITPSALKAALVEAGARAIYDAEPLRRYDTGELLPWDSPLLAGARALCRRKSEAALSAMPPVLERFGVKALHVDQPECPAATDLTTAHWTWEKDKARRIFALFHDAAPRVAWEE